MVISSWKNPEKSFWDHYKNHSQSHIFIGYQPKKFVATSIIIKKTKVGWFNHVDSAFRVKKSLFGSSPFLVIPNAQGRSAKTFPRCLHLAQVDVFSFAMVIYEIICREVPFEEEADAIFKGGSGMIFDMMKTWVNYGELLLSDVGEAHQ